METKIESRTQRWCRWSVVCTVIAGSIVFSKQPAEAQSLKVLYSFRSGQRTSDGFYPDSGVIRDSAGNLYGTTVDGGTYAYGTVFKLTPTNKESILYSFRGKTDGGYPSAGLVRDSSGNLYGTTQIGGAYNSGVVFKLGSAGRETVLYSFGKTPTDGSYPWGLLRDSAGNLYGVTVVGGLSDAGTVYKLDTSGVETILYNFTGTGSDQGYPNPGIVRDASGNLYGTTMGPGPNTGVYGTVYKVDSSGNQTVLYTFTGGTDGSFPQSGLLRDSEGNLYGTTVLGGSFGFGVVFKIDSAKTETVLHSFTGTDGEDSTGTLIQDSAGNLYGTTAFGGEYGWGTVFRVDTSNNERVLYSFTGGIDGKYPTWNRLVRDSAGNLYGTTQNGGSADWGEIFQLKP